MRAIDRLTVERFAIPSLLLMESAAQASARAIAARFPGHLSQRKVSIFCGPGNNGGDGAALARTLLLEGASVTAILCGAVESAKGDVRVNFEILKHLSKSSLPGPSSCSSFTFRECHSESDLEGVIAKLAETDVIVDALFGTGLTRPLSGLYGRIVKFINQVRVQRNQAHLEYPLIVSLDIPSGLNADSADPLGDAVAADLTVAFTAPKPANVLPPASNLNGQLEIVQIGSPAELLDGAASKLFLLERSDAQAWLASTRYTPDSYKNLHGHALIVAGSRNFSGAAVLCANAAMRSGAGLVTVAAPASALSLIAPRLLPEVMSVPLPETAEATISEKAFESLGEISARATVTAIGPGLSATDEGTKKFVRRVVEQRRTPVVIDADGLNALAPWPEILQGSPDTPLILTPHLGEMRRLIDSQNDSPLMDRVGVAREFATAHHLIVVLKGSRMIVASPDGKVFINPTGNPGAGTAGAGDTLTGFITGFLAQSTASLKDKADALSATLSALYVAGLACDLAARAHGMRALVATDIREHLSAAVCSLDQEGEFP